MLLFSVSVIGVLVVLGISFWNQRVVMQLMIVSGATGVVPPSRWWREVWDFY